MVLHASGKTPSYNIGGMFSAFNIMKTDAFNTFNTLMEGNNVPDLDYIYNRDSYQPEKNAVYEDLTVTRKVTHYVSTSRVENINIIRSKANISNKGYVLSGLEILAGVGMVVRGISDLIYHKHLMDNVHRAEELIENFNDVADAILTLCSRGVYKADTSDSDY
jgi:hypothetical protein